MNNIYIFNDVYDSNYLKFLNDVLILTSYIPLYASTMNFDHKKDTINFI